MEVEFTSSHKCIKNTSTCGVILTDYLLDTSKPHIQPKLQERSPCMGRAKKRNQNGTELYPWEGSVKEKRFPHPGNPLHQLGDQLGRRGDSEAQQRVSSWLGAGRTD